MGKNMRKSRGLIFSSGLFLATLFGNPVFANDSAPPEKTLQELLQERLQDMLARLQSFKGPEIEQLRIARQRVVIRLEQLLGRTTELPALAHEQRSGETGALKSQPLAASSATDRPPTSALPPSPSDDHSTRRTASANTSSSATSAEGNVSVPAGRGARALAAGHAANATSASITLGGSKSSSSHTGTASTGTSSTSGSDTSSSDDWQAALLSHFDDFFALMAALENLPKPKGTIVPHLPGNVAGHGGSVHTHEMPVPIDITVEDLILIMNTLKAAIAAAIKDPLLPEEIRKGLQLILKRLNGNNEGFAKNGLIDKLEAGDLVAALRLLLMVVQQLQGLIPEGDPAIIGVQTFLLELIRKFVGERLQLVTDGEKPTDLVESGDTAASNGQFVEAVKFYKMAVQMIVEADTSPPFLIFEKPQLGQGLQESQFVIQVSYTDALSAIDPASVRIFLNGVERTADAQITQGGLTLDLFALDISLPEGKHFLRVVVSDTAPTKNTQDFTIFFFVDQTPPVITSLLPAPGSIVDVRRVEITGSFEDALSGTSSFRVRLLVDGVDVTGQTFRTNTSVFFSTTSLAEGEHFVRLEIRDRAGNPAAAETRFIAIRDETPPRITITPSPGTIISGFGVINLTIEEPESGLEPQKVSVFADSSNVTEEFSFVQQVAPDGRVIALSGSFNLDAEGVARLLQASGKFEISLHVLAQDRFGNRSELVAGYPVSLDAPTAAAITEAGFLPVTVRLAPITPPSEEGIAGHCGKAPIIAVQAFNLLTGLPQPGVAVDFTATEGLIVEAPGLGRVTDGTGMAGVRYIYPREFRTATIRASVSGGNAPPVFATRTPKVPTVAGFITQAAPMVENHVVTSVTFLEAVRTPVEFRVLQGTGRVLPENTVTDDKGFAIALYSQPTTGSVAIEVRFPEFPLVRDLLTGRVGPSILLNWELVEDTAMKILHGNYQIGATGQELPEFMRVQLVDKALNPVTQEINPATGEVAPAVITFKSAGFGTFRSPAGPVEILRVPVDSHGRAAARFTPNGTRLAAVNVLWEPTRPGFALRALAGLEKFLSVDFLIGLPEGRLVRLAFQRNPDGTLRRDAAGNAIPVLDERGRQKFEPIEAPADFIRAENLFDHRGFLRNPAPENLFFFEGLMPSGFTGTLKGRVWSLDICEVPLSKQVFDMAPRDVTVDLTPAETTPRGTILRSPALAATTSSHPVTPGGIASHTEVKQFAGGQFAVQLSPRGILRPSIISAMSPEEEVPLADEQGRQPKKVVILLIDGLRKDLFDKAFDPFGTVRFLLGIGDVASFDNVQTVFPTLTVPAVTSLVRGTFPRNHGLSGNELVNRSPQEFTIQGPPHIRKIRQHFALINGANERLRDAMSTFTTRLVEQLNLSGADVPGEETSMLARAHARGQGSAVISSHFPPPREAGPFLFPLSSIAAGVPPQLLGEFLRFGIVGKDGLGLDTAVRDLAQQYFSDNKEGKSHSIVLIHFPGLDQRAHYEMSSETDLMNHLKALEKLLFDLRDVMRQTGNFEETAFILTADHGHTAVLNDDDHALHFHQKIKKIFADSGRKVFDKADDLADVRNLIKRTNLESSEEDVVFCSNDGMAQIYVRKTPVRIDEILFRPWVEEPDFEKDVKPVAERFLRASRVGKNVPLLKGTIEAILVRTASGQPYMALELDQEGKLLPLLTIPQWLNLKIAELASQPGMTPGAAAEIILNRYVDMERRLAELNSFRSGDIILIPTMGTTLGERFYFSNTPLFHVHGSLNHFDTFIPLAVGFPGGGLQDVVDLSITLDSIRASVIQTRGRPFTITDIDDLVLHGILNPP